MSKFMTRCTFSLIALAILPNDRVHAFPFLYSGIHQIADSGAGVLSGQDASSSVANPAGLAEATKTASYADFSVVSVKYIYAHTNYDPVYLDTVAPPINVGFNLNTKLGINFGFLISPRSMPGAKPMHIDDVPTYAGEGYALFDLDTKQTGLMAAAGAGYRLPGTGWSLGTSVLYGEDGQEITAYANEGDHSVPGMDLKYSGSSYQGLFGLRYRSSVNSSGITFRSASTRYYRGDIASALTDNIYDHFHGVSYNPAQIALAFERKLSEWSYLVQLNRDFWSLGRSTANRGLPYSSPQTDFKDSFGIVTAFRFSEGSSRVYSVSCGHYSANTGDGSVDFASTKLAESAIPAQTGMEFGQMEAIPRYVIGAGFSQTRSDDLGYWMFSGNYQTGTRVIPVGHKGEGWYHLDVLTLSAGMNFKF